ncbi:hypothetical protein [Photorhabdus antumapuensis]|uniref:hypothetical protein n=1 Tax=Photorhabdus antumapuensis TaxID=2862867 RepID=UPI001CEC279F|nr:hypothetical protein [Photorhabdus antumapuensis]
MHRTADETCSEVGCTSGCQPCELVQSPSENDINYHIHTESIKTNIIPALEINPKARNFAYANEADILNLALFGKTASDWRKENPELKGNIRDYATLEQLVVLSNLESFNAELIGQGLSTNDRFQKLNRVAVSQMEILIENKSIEKLKQLK